jgi:polyisoprenoid-binding protein YceI
MLTKRLIAATLVVFAANTLKAQETARVAVAPDSKLWIDGTSNLHSWSCKADKIEASVDLDKTAAAELNAAPPKALKRVEVKVPVKALKCGHDAMDNNLYKALNADATPDVTYILATFEAAPGTTADTFTLKTVGSLSIAGKENQLAMDVVATRMPDGTVIAKGTVPIKMTDYGIKPPTAIFGRLKTGDEVKVNFELTIGGKAIATALEQK